MQQTGILRWINLGFVCFYGLGVFFYFYSKNQQAQADADQAAIKERDTLACLRGEAIASAILFVPYKLRSIDVLPVVATLNAKWEINVSAANQCMMPTCMLFRFMFRPPWPT